MREYENSISKSTDNKTDGRIRYIIIEVNGHYTGAGACINELTFFNKNNEKIDYKVLSELEYDSITKGKSTYWTETRYWNYTNLNDGATSYTSNSEGGQNSTIFLYPATGNDVDSWSRFVIDFGDYVEIKQIRTNVGDVEGRTPKKITIYSVRDFIDGIDENSTYYKNIKERNNENLTKIGQIDIEEEKAFPIWIDFLEDSNSLKTRYAIVEVKDHYSGVGACINELKVYDNYNERSNYKVLSDLEYDSITKGKSTYWTDVRYWNYTNLNDGATSYTSNSEGGQNSTIFLCPATENDVDSWSRFIIDLETEIDIKQIETWLGGVEGRTPKNINVYKINNFVNGTGDNSTYALNVHNRSNEGLTKIIEKYIEKDLIVSTKINLIN